MNRIPDHNTQEHRDRVRTQLNADALKVLSRLDREIVALQRLAPLDYEATIAGLKEALEVMRGTMDLPN